MDNTTPRRGGQEVFYLVSGTTMKTFIKVNNLDKQIIVSYLDELSLASVTETQNESLVKNITQMEIIKNY